MGGFLVWNVGEIDFWLGIGFWQRIFYLVFWIACGGVIYFLSLLLMGVRPSHFRSEPQ
jgi:putative peptidoglycan lipid II flippase